MGHILVDFDRTLAVYEKREGPLKLGPPVPKMLNRVKKWLSEGKEVRIFTARIADPYEPVEEITHLIEDWCLEHLGQKLQITCSKNHETEEIWDDLAVGIESNTGELKTQISIEELSKIILPAGKTLEEMGHDYFRG